MAEENNYEKFKNIGIDVDFIETNAAEHNDKIQQFYTGGNPNQNIQEPVKKTEDQPVQTQTEKHSTNQQNESVEQKMEPQVDMSAIEALVDKKVHELALKMQQYADETDKKIADLEAALSKAKESAKVEVTQKTIPESSPKEEAPVSKDSGFDRSDVAIDKMFNFSNNNTGKINR